MFDIILPDDISQLDLLSEQVSEYAHTAGIGEETLYRLQVIVEELFVNFVEHELSASGRFELIIDADESMLHLTLMDDGQPFNPLEVEVADTTAPLDERQVGCLGLNLVREMTSECSYERAPGRNVIRLTIPRVRDA